jgi:hypothetical protein
LAKEVAPKEPEDWSLAGETTVYNAGTIHESPVLKPFHLTVFAPTMILPPYCVCANFGEKRVNCPGNSGMGLFSSSDHKIIKRRKKPHSAYSTGGFSVQRIEYPKYLITLDLRSRPTETVFPLHLGFGYA